MNPAPEPLKRHLPQCASPFLRCKTQPATAPAFGRSTGETLRIASTYFERRDPVASCPDGMEVAQGQSVFSNRAAALLSYAKLVGEACDATPVSQTRGTEEVKGRTAPTQSFIPRGLRRCRAVLNSVTGRRGMAAYMAMCPVSWPRRNVRRLSAIGGRSPGHGRQSRRSPGHVRRQRGRAHFMRRTAF